MGEMLQLLFPLLLLAFAYLIGRHLEKRHFRIIREREEACKWMPIVTFLPNLGARPIDSAEMVYGCVVVSLDHFKRFLAALRSIVGGRIKAYEPLLDRARREAILRMKESAIEKGYQVVVNVRLETSRLASAGKQGKGTTGVEILAFGTAVKPQG